MDRKFEKWISEQKDLNNNIIECFHESVRCYRSNCYRSAIIMAISGFNFIIRDRILKEKNNISNQTSQSTNNEIKIISTHINDPQLIDDDKWDSFLNSTLLQKTRFNYIFNLNKNSKIFEDWVYWKNKRNISAHTKSYNIIFADVEACYSWIIQTLDILYPFTNTDLICENIKNFFNPYFTSIYEKTDSICKEIDIVNKNMDKIIDTLLEILKDKKDERIYDIISFIINKSKNNIYYTNHLIEKIIYDKHIISEIIKITCDNIDIFKYLNHNNQYIYLNKILYYMAIHIDNNKNFDEYIYKLIDILILLYNKKEYNYKENIRSAIITASKIEDPYIIILLRIIAEIIKREENILINEDIKKIFDNRIHFLDKEHTIFIIDFILKNNIISEEDFITIFDEYTSSKINILYKNITDIDNNKYPYLYDFLIKYNNYIIFKKLDDANKYFYLDLSNLTEKQLSKIIEECKNNIRISLNITRYFKMNYLEEYKRKYGNTLDIDYLIKLYNNYEKERDYFIIE